MYSDILFCIIGVHKVFRIKLLIILEPDHAFRIEDFMLLCPGKSPYFSDIVCELVSIFRNGWSLQGPLWYRAYNWRHCFLVGRPQQVLTVRDGITSKKVVSILMIPTGDNKQVLGPWLQSANRGQDSFLCIFANDTLIDRMIHFIKDQQINH